MKGPMGVDVNMVDVQIRSMSVKDIPEVMEIEKLSFSVPWSEESFRNEIESNMSARYMVVETGKTVAAYGGMWIILDEGHITNIAVHPDYRGRGLGNAIVEALLSAARQEKVRALTLEVRRTNIIAQNLYLKYGFEAVGIRPKYYADNGEDAIIMWKRNV